MSHHIISVQSGEGRKANRDQYLRCEVEGGVEEVRKAITQMFRKPSDFDLGKKRYGNTHRTRRSTAPVIRLDDERVGDGEPAELVAT